MELVVVPDQARKIWKNSDKFERSGWNYGEKGYYKGCYGKRVSDQP